MKTYKKECYKTKEEWLKARGIGGSDAAAIIGKSKWLTINDVYNDKALGKPKVIKQNELMEDGTKAEKHLRELFALNYKQFKVKKSKGFWLIRDKKYPELTVSPDSLLEVKQNKELFGLELKKVRLYKHEEKVNWENNLLPNQYYCQALHYMVVINDLKGVYVYAELDYYNYNEDTEQYEYQYSKLQPYFLNREDCTKDVEYLRKKEIEFIENNLRPKKRPNKITI